MSQRNPVAAVERLSPILDTVSSGTFMQIAASTMLLTCTSTIRILMANMDDRAMTKEQKFDFCVQNIRTMCLESPEISKQLLTAALEMDDLPEIIDLSGVH